MTYSFASDFFPSSELSPFVPSSPGELFLAFLLAFPSLLFIVYLVTILYRCVCSRNYAEWRATWTNETASKKDVYTQVSE